MEEVLVSIDCSTYNHEKYIRKTIEGFLMQKTKFKYEILIHDDASTDNTQEIILEYQKKYPEIIKPILQKENQYSKGTKISYTFNVLRAEGKYIAKCEGDDYWTDPYKLQKQIDYMEKNPECGLCFHAYEVEANGEIVKQTRQYNSNCIVPIEDILFFDGDFITTNSIVYRKEIMLNVPDFYFECCVGDYPLQIYTAINKYAYYINESMSVYRYMSENSWTKRMIMDKDSNKKIIKIRKNVINMLDAIDIYTKNIYSDIINQKKMLLEMDILLLEDDLRGLKQLKKSKSNLFKQVYKKIELKQKIKYQFPEIFKFIRKFKKY